MAGARSLLSGRREVYGELDDNYVSVMSRTVVRGCCECVYNTKSRDKVIKSHYFYNYAL